MPTDSPSLCVLCTIGEYRLMTRLSSVNRLSSTKAAYVNTGIFTFIVSTFHIHPHLTI